jgi:membrane associated rhomboid family serine protease
MTLSITTLIVIITVIVSLIAENNYSLKDRLLFSPYHITKYNQYYRFITSGFIHGGYLHLAFNMISLFFFGNNVVEPTFQRIFPGSTGSLFYLILYFGGMIVADIPSFIKNRNSYSYRALGASGAVSAIVFSGIMFYPNIEISLFFIVPIPGFVFAALYLFYSYYQSRYGNDNIGHDAHLFGALFGIVFTIAIYPPVIQIFIENFRNFRFFNR